MSKPLTAGAIGALKTSLRGPVIEPADPDYAETRKVYNAMIDKKPLAIARCADVADVIACVNFARENKLLLAIRGGGHNAGGLGIADDALVIDLSPIKYARVDPAAATVTVGGGCTWGQVDRVTAEHGCVVPSGVISNAHEIITAKTKPSAMITTSAFITQDGASKVGKRIDAA